MSRDEFFPNGAPSPEQLPDPARVPMTTQLFIRVTHPDGHAHLAVGDPRVAGRLAWGHAHAHARSVPIRLGQFRAQHPDHTFRGAAPVAGEHLTADYSSVADFPDDSVVELCLLTTPVGGPIPLGPPR